MHSPNYFDRKRASEYLLATWGLKRSVNYLAKLAVVGGGPAFHKAGRDPLYSPSSLDTYAKRIIGPELRSTSDRPQAAA